MTGKKGLLVAAVCAAGMGASATARAQANPKFEFGKAEDLKDVVYQAQVKAGGVITTGNSESQTFALSALFARRDPKNRISIEGGITYVHSNVLTIDNCTFADPMNPAQTKQGPCVDPMSKLITKAAHQDLTASNMWFVKGRYDRFFTPNNSGYLALSVLSDNPAGKDLVLGGQLGYSRQLYRSERHEVVVEAGYDFSFVRFTTVGSESVQIHSGRVFAGYNVKLHDMASANLSCELLDNFNEEGAPYAGSSPADRKTKVPVLADVRVNAKAGLAFTLWKNFSFAVGFTLKYDNAPAPRAIGGVGFDPTASDELYFVNKLDTITEATLIVNFL